MCRCVCSAAPFLSRSSVDNSHRVCLLTYRGFRGVAVITSV